MIAVVQRVLTAGVFVDDPPYEEQIAKGLCVFLGVEHGDTNKDAMWIAKKLANLRIFNDDEGKMNRSVIDIGGEILLVSQFTLAGDCSQGNRPSFVHAAEPTIAAPLVEKVGEILQFVSTVNNGCTSQNYGLENTTTYTDNFSVKSDSIITQTLLQENGTISRIWTSDYERQ